MKRKLYVGGILLALVPVLTSLAAHAVTLANRVFVSARSGNDANSCDNVNTPCQTFAGAVLQAAAFGTVIVLDSGGYGPVTITQSVTIEAPTGVTAFIHPPSGSAVTVSAAPSDTVTLRGLTLNTSAPFGLNGITVNSVGVLNVENCFIAGFSFEGIDMHTAGVLNVKGTDITYCSHGISLTPNMGAIVAAIDHCHLDGNSNDGFLAGSFPPGRSTTTATFTTANNNGGAGWLCGYGSSGRDVLNLEFCTGSGNVFPGLGGNSDNPLSAARYSNCVFSNNGTYGVSRLSAGTFESRGNNTITGNGLAPINGTIGSFSPM